MELHSTAIPARGEAGRPKAVPVLRDLAVAKGGLERTRLQWRCGGGGADGGGGMGGGGVGLCHAACDEFALVQEWTKIKRWRHAPQ